MALSRVLPVAFLHSRFPALLWLDGTATSVSVLNARPRLLSSRIGQSSCRGWGAGCSFLSRPGASQDDCPSGERGQRPQRKLSAPQHILAPTALFRDRQSSPLKVHDLPRQVGTRIDAASRIFSSTPVPPQPSCFCFKISNSE